MSTQFFFIQTTTYYIHIYLRCLVLHFKVNNFFLSLQLKLTAVYILFYFVIITVHIDMYKFTFGYSFQLLQLLVNWTKIKTHSIKIKPNIAKKQFVKLISDDLLGCNTTHSQEIQMTNVHMYRDGNSWGGEEVERCWEEIHIQFPKTLTHTCSYVHSWW